jgi:glycosyltransferase involved in cell wall biosynthesis
MMRIALISQEYPPETARGGIGTQTELKARGLAARGHEVAVVTCSVDGRRAVAERGGVRVVRVPDAGVADSEPGRWRARSAAVAAELGRLAAEAPLDVVDFPDYGAEGYAWLRRRTPDDPAAAVVQIHGPLVMLAHTIGWPALDSDLYHEGTAMEAACLERADLVYASSACSAAWCAERYGARTPIPVLHAGVDVEAFTPPAPEHRAPLPRIAFVGRVARSKGADTLVEAALHLRRTFPGLKVELLGRVDSSLDQDLRAAAAAAPGLLEIPGPVPRTTLAERLARAWVFAAPSRYEGGPGFVVLEAMACGLPVVAGDRGGVGEAFRHGEHGFFVPPGDAPALAAAIGRLLVDARLRGELGAAARRHVVETADTRRCVGAIEMLYRQAAARRVGAVAAGSASR